jgi:uncharacterized coiled-coil DUF342 family protein
MADALEAIIEEVKQLRKKLDELEAKGVETKTLQTKIEGLEAKLNSNPNFGSWD